MKVKILSLDEKFSSVEFTNGSESWIPTKGSSSNLNSKDYWTVKFPTEFTDGPVYFKLTIIWSLKDRKVGDEYELSDLAKTRTKSTEDRPTGHSNGPVIRYTVDNVTEYLLAVFPDDKEVEDAVQVIRNKYKAARIEEAKLEREKILAALAKLDEFIGDKN